MAIDFNALKSNRGNFGSLMKEVEKIAQPASQDSKKDERFWQPEVDKAGNGYAVIRFLPPPAGEDLPWARVWSHGFKGPSGKWYIENSLTTIGKADPVSELNSELWNIVHTELQNAGYDVQSGVPADTTGTNTDSTGTVG